ncbi:hypothetical protein [Tissierella praeacuta]|uniref:hypothetical protein n=1 Tax=Tissierella praeacuta TaxID=43131 RepID=UPI0028A5E64E|nr:hypothetical protein [Tissierella praeacuta]
MKYKLLWSEDNDMAMGYKGHFKSEENFIEQVKAEFKSFDNKDCIVKDIKIEPCIETESGFPGDVAIPLSATDIEIANYYTATVIELD